MLLLPNYNTRLTG